MNRLQRGRSKMNHLQRGDQDEPPPERQEQDEPIPERQEGDRQSITFELDSVPIQSIHFEPVPY